MSPSAFHRQFKTLTSMTPLQYQKRLRLLEARHLMVAGEANAKTAAYRVGYESASQFSREYARMFGAPKSHGGERKPAPPMGCSRHGQHSVPAPAPKLPNRPQHNVQHRKILWHNGGYIGISEITDKATFRCDNIDPVHKNIAQVIPSCAEIRYKAA